MFSESYDKQLSDFDYASSKLCEFILEGRLLFQPDEDVSGAQVTWPEEDQIPSGLVW